MYKYAPGVKFTIDEIAKTLDVLPSMVERVGSKNLFIVRKENKLELYSYTTKVGETKLENGQAIWLLTIKKYTPTTSKQLTQFANTMRRNGIGVKYVMRYNDDN